MNVFNRIKKKENEQLFIKKHKNNKAFKIDE